MSQRVPNRKAFTLVELLVVIAIIGVLVALLLPAVQAAREAARRSSCSNKIRQLAIGLHNHHDTNNKFPPGAQSYVFPVPKPATSPTSFRGTSWIVFVLPFIEQQNLYDKYSFDEQYDSTDNGLVGATVVPTLYCPSGPDPLKHLDPNGNGVKNNPSTHYYGVMGPAAEASPVEATIGGTTYKYTAHGLGANGAWSTHGILSQFSDDNSKDSNAFMRIVRMADVIDGTSNTLMVAERSRQLPAGQTNDYRSWIRGANSGSGAVKNVTYAINTRYYDNGKNFNDIAFGSEHPAGCTFVMADASVKFLSEQIDINLYKGMASMNGAETVQIP